MRKRFKKWVMGRTDVMDRILDDASEIYDQPRETIKKQRMELVREMEERPGYERTLEAEQKGFYLIYHIVAVISCILLIGPVTGRRMSGRMKWWNAMWSTVWRRPAPSTLFPV